MKIFVTHVNAHQKAASAHEDFNNQVDRVTHSLDASQPLPLAAARWAHEQSAHGGRDAGYARAQQPGPHSQSCPGCSYH